MRLSCLCGDYRCEVWTRPTPTPTGRGTPTIHVLTNSLPSPVPNFRPCKPGRHCIFSATRYQLLSITYRIVVDPLQLLADFLFSEGSENLRGLLAQRRPLPIHCSCFRIRRMKTLPTSLSTRAVTERPSRSASRRSEPVAKFRIGRAPGLSPFERLQTRSTIFNAWNRVE